MTLQGDLSEFGIPEIFQLLEQQGKTGCLHVKTDIKEIEVYFREGMVVGTFPGGETPWDCLIGLLRRIGYLSEADVRKLQKRQENDLMSLKGILQDEGLMGSTEIDMLLREHVEELLFPVFQKRKGEFHFVQDETLASDWELREPLRAEPLVLEGLRKIDEWPLLKKGIGSFQEVPERRLALSEVGRLPWSKRLGGFWKKLSGVRPEEDEGGLEDDSPLEGEPYLSSSEKIVYSLIDGRRTVEEIIQASLLGEFSACQAFLSLTDRGWIRFSGSAVRAAEERRTVEAVKYGEKTNLVKGALAFGGLVVLLLFIQLVTQGPQQKRLTVPTSFHGEPTVCRLLNYSERDRVRNALETYRMEKGRYPGELTDLVEERLLRQEDLSPWGSNSFSYFVEPDGGFRLLIAPVP